MSKELVVSANRHETRVALLDDDKLVEVSIERIAEHALAGSVYKGRVSRVLPGMQSAFVKIGLERDAFLYVSDVIDETADLEDGTLDDPEDSLVAAGPSSSASEPAKKGRSRSDRPERKAEETPAEERPSGRDKRGRRSRRRRRDRNKEETLLPESKFADVDELGAKEKRPSKAKPSKAEKPAADHEEDDDYGLTLLPGESLAKYGSAPPRMTTRKTRTLAHLAASRYDDADEAEPYEEETSSAERIRGRGCRRLRRGGSGPDDDDSQEDSNDDDEDDDEDSDDEDESDEDR